MASLGPLYGTNATTVGGSTAWATPANANNDNTVYTTCTPSLTAANNSYLTLQGFDFSALPSDAVITGVVAEIKKKRTGGTTGDLRDQNIALMKVGVVGQNRGATTTNWGTVDAVSTYGTSTDLWGTTWTRAEVTTATFGLRIQVTQFGTSSNRVANVDYGRLTVYYTSASQSNTPDTVAVPLKTFSMTSFAPTVTNSSGLKPLPSQLRATYFANYSGIGRITDVPTSYNQINLFQADPDGTGTGAYVFNYPASVTSAEITTVRGRGQRVVLTVGGSGAAFNFDTRTKSNAFIASFKTMVTNLGGVIDGIDINTYEQFNQTYPGTAQSPNAMWATAATELIYIAQQLKAFYGTNFTVSTPPHPGEYYAPFDWYLAKAMVDANCLDYVAPQYYDSADLTEQQYQIDNTNSWVAHLGDAAYVALSVGANYSEGSPTGVTQNVWGSIYNTNPAIRGFVAWNSQTDAAATPAWQFGTAMEATMVQTVVVTPWSAGTAAEGTGWTNPTNALTSNDARAVATVTGGAETGYLMVRGFNLPIPAGAVPKTIEIRIEGYTSAQEDYAYAFMNKGSDFSTFRSLKSAGVEMGVGADGITVAKFNLADGVTTTNAPETGTKSRDWLPSDFDSTLTVSMAFAGAMTVNVDAVAARLSYVTAAQAAQVAVPPLSFIQTERSVQVIDKVNVPTKSFVQTMFAPTVSQGGGVATTIAVPTLSFAQSGFVPVVNAKDKVDVPLKSFTQTGLVPLVNAKEIVQVPLKSFVQTRFVPTVIETTGVVVPTLSFVQTGFAPVVNAKEIIAVPLKSFIQTGLVPLVNAKEVIAVPLKSFVQTSLVPVVNAKEIIAVPVKSFVQTGFAPTIINNSNVNTPTLSFVQTGFAPNVNAKDVVQVPVLSFVQTRLDVTAVEKINVPVKSFVQTGFAPVVNAKDVVQVATLSFVQSANEQKISERFFAPVLSFVQSSNAVKISEQINVPALGFVQTGPVVNAKEIFKAPGPLSFTQSAFAPVTNAQTKMDSPTLSFAQSAFVPNVNAKDKVDVGVKSFVQTTLDLVVNAVDKVEVPSKSFAQTGLVPVINAQTKMDAPTLSMVLNTLDVKVNEKINVEPHLFLQSTDVVLISERVNLPTLGFKQETFEVKISEQINVPSLEFVQTAFVTKTTEVINTIGTLAFVQTSYEVRVKDVINVPTLEMAMSLFDAVTPTLVHVDVGSFVQTGLEVDVHVNLAPLMVGTVFWTQIVPGEDGKGAVLQRMSQSGTFRLKDRAFYTLPDIPVVKGTLSEEQISVLAEV